MEKEVSILTIPEHHLTPGMRQYRDAKKEQPDCIIMMRMGDFYELFYEDAITCSRVLEITLTARGKGEKRAPLAGIPYHALDGYLARLVKKGFKVAIVEQLEDPKKAKGLVKRGIVRVVTPGTVIEDSMLSEKDNNYVMSCWIAGSSVSAAYCDMSTGEFYTTQYDSISGLLYDITKMTPSECILPASLLVDQELVTSIKEKGCYINSIEDFYYKTKNAEELLHNHFTVPASQFGLEDPASISVAGALLHYLISTQKNSLSHIKRVLVRGNAHRMLLDSSTFRNLELVKNNSGEKTHTLLSVIDQTVTSMGSRLLKKWIASPLLQREAIEKRLNAVDELNKNVITREDCITILKDVYDIERLISRVNYGNASPKDVIALRQSLGKVPLLKEKLVVFSSSIMATIKEMDDLQELTRYLQSAIKDDAPLVTRNGGMIQDGFNEELDSLRSIARNSKEFLAELEGKEKERTGISSLKIAYNRVFGYYIEVTKKNLSLVPEHYIRKQTTANGERYITEELKVEEEKILGAQEKIVQLEYDLFQTVLEKIACSTEQIQDVARKIAVLDVLCSLSSVSMQNSYCKPQFVDENVLHISKGRHPVVEKHVQRFIPNDVQLADGETMIITGPNMAGKSTVMRQTALIVLLAQMGSFVSAEECVLGVVDRIFTRVGASDDISSGQSTFMVEMSETASILHNATERSLIILDEIGRGTSTFDGVSIAWSVAEHIYNSVKAKTMFATHYHVMNKLGEKFERMTNYNIAVSEKHGEIVFLHKLVIGGTDQSYGIHVAELAGMPSSVVSRAREVQSLLEKDDSMVRKISVKKLQEQKELGEW